MQLIMPTDHKILLHERHEVALFLINKINGDTNSYTIWEEVHRQSLLPKGIVCETALVNTNNCCLTQSSDNDCSSAEHENYHYSKDSIQFKNSINLLNHLLEGSTEVKNCLTSELDSESIGFSLYGADSGYNSEIVTQTSKIIEMMYNNLMDLSNKPDAVNNVCIDKSLSLLKKTASREDVASKLIDLIRATIECDSKNDTISVYSIVLWEASSKQNLERIFILQRRAFRYIAGVKQSSLNCVYRFKVIQEICTEDEIITLKTVDFLLHKIVSCNKELIICKSFDKLTTVFHFIEAVNQILSDYKAYLLNINNTLQKPGSKFCTKMSKIKLLKKLQTLCVESVKLLEEQWTLSFVSISMQTCLLSICDIVTLLQSFNR